MTHDSKPLPSPAQILRTLDEMAAAAREGDGDRYRAALRVAQDQGLSVDQMTDAYRWGRRDLGAAHFDWRGEGENTKTTPTTLDSNDKLD